jgi:hypothetical protein
MQGAGGQQYQLQQSRRVPSVHPPCCSPCGAATPAPSVATKSAACGSAAAAECCAIADKSARCSTGSRGGTGSSAPSWQHGAPRSDGSGGQTNMHAFAHFNNNPIVGLISLRCFACAHRAIPQSGCTLQHAGAPEGVVCWVGGVLQGAQRRGRVKHQSESESGWEGSASGA